MYDENTVRHMMRLQAWRELRWVLDEYEQANLNHTLEEIIKRRMTYFEGHNLSDKIPSISLRHY